MKRTIAQTLVAIKKIKKYIFILIVFLGFDSISAQENRPIEVCIRDTEVRIIESSIVDNTEYEIHITLPDGYHESESSYPVLYYLDAYHWGGIVIETYRLLRAFKEIDRLILVGISYKDATREKEYFYRSRDFMPTVITAENQGHYSRNVPPVSGGASAFLEFIKKELKPLIAKNYRSQEKYSGILGISNGALFASYVLFNEPSEFENYILGSPRLDRDDFVVLKFEEKYFNNSQYLPANIFLSVGSEDSEHILLSWIRLRDRLQGRNYIGMNLKVTTFEGENHTSGIPATISRGIRELYKTEK